MKILVLSSYSSSLVNFRGPLIRSLSLAGHEIIAAGPEKSLDVVEQLNQWGVSFQQIELARTGMNPIRDIKFMWKVLQVLRDNQIDALISYTVKPVIYGSLAARIMRIPHTYSLITGLGYSFMGLTYKHRLVGHLVKFLYKIALRKNKGVFFQNSDDLELFQRLRLISSDTEVHLVNGSGVDLSKFSLRELPNFVSSCGEDTTQHSGVIFLLIARLISEKGIYEYVEAARRLKVSYPNCRFQLMGGYESRPASISVQEIEDWEKKGIIEYLGEQKDVRPFLEACHVYVLPSYREGAPRTVMEAMAIGRPIVTTNVPGCRQTVVPGVNGFLVAEKNSIQLFEAMEKFIHNPNLVSRMSIESRRLAEEKYDALKISRDMVATMNIRKNH